MDKPATPPNTAAARNLPSYAWWLVLGLVGLDCFSTLAYLPTIAVDGAERMAPLAAAAVAILILFVALPIYLYIVGRSPQGRGATGLLESHLHGWGGKFLILILLGFVATDFVMTRTVSLADASKHLIHNPVMQSGLDWMMQRKAALQVSLQGQLHSTFVDQCFAWWDEQLTVAVLLLVLSFGFFFFLLRGFTRGFMVVAAIVVAVFLLMNALVIGSSLVYVAQHPAYLTNWEETFTFDYGKAERFRRYADEEKEKEDAGPEEGEKKPVVPIVKKSKPWEDQVMFAFDLLWLAVLYLPALVLGLSGFELSMTSAPLVRGGAGDDPARPRGRIRNARKLLVATAVLMSVLVPTSVLAVTLLVPSQSMKEDGPARHRALAYLAHGGTIQTAGARFATDTPSDKTVEGDDSNERRGAPEEAPERPKAAEEDAQRSKAAYPPAKPPTGADLNPVFGPYFGALYDLSAVLILCLAGASVTISLRDLLPEYLMRYGMAMHWAQRIGVLLHLFNAILLVVVIVFRASVAQQRGAYATSVLVLLAGAALAASIDLRARWRRSAFRPLLTLPLLLFCGFFLVLAYTVCRASPAGAVIALLFIATVFATAALSRWMRSTELRYYGFTFADEESGVRWEEIRRLEFQVLVPHHHDHLSLAEKDAEIRARHRLGPDVPIIFIEAELGDPSDFQSQPLMRIVKENGMEVIRVSQCASIAHVLAAIALEFREVGQPPEIHFAWSEETPLASNLSFLLFGEGNVPWMVHALIRKAERDATRQPRVVIG